MKIKPPVALPYLRKPPALGYTPPCLTINPGLSRKYANLDLERRFPIIFPLAENEADNLLESMRKISGQEHLLNYLPEIRFNESADYYEELASLAEFTGKHNTDNSRERQILIHAQKTLIFRFLQEMIQEEISSLEERLRTQENDLQAMLDENLIEGEQDGQNISFPENNFAWRATVESALFFISPEYPIFCQGRLAESALENLQFNSQAYPGFEGEARLLRFAHAPAWQALGFNSGNRYKFLLSWPGMLNNFIENRYWIISANA